MITDARALQPEYVPQELEHRDGKKDQLSAYLRPIMTGSRGQDVLIYGPSGAGKTTLAKHVLGKLEREVLDVRWGYVSCMGYSTAAALLHELVLDAGRGTDLRKDGTPTATFLDRLESLDGQFVAVIDEVDAIDDPKTLLSLYRLPNVTLALITVDVNAFFSDRDLDPRVESRLRSTSTLHLEKYSYDELRDILQKRAHVGLVHNSISRDAIDQIADQAAGDARLGIAHLRRSARYVLENDVDTITPEIVEIVEEDALNDIREHHVRDLSTHKRLLYDIIRDAGKITASEVKSRYEAEAADPKTDRTRRRYLDSLERYNLIQSDGATSATYYEIVER